MHYTIESDLFEIDGKKKGDTVTDKELLEAGLNVKALVDGGHLSGKAQPKPATDKGAGE
jgi:hypothetical protein